MQRAKYMILLIIGLMALAVSYYIVIAIMVLVITFYAAKALSSLSPPKRRRSWN